MDDANAYVETTTQWRLNGCALRQIDGEIATLEKDVFSGEPLTSYLRYKAQLSLEWIRENLNEVCTYAFGET